MTDTNHSGAAQSDGQNMSVVINREMTIVWADPPALAYFGKQCVGKRCYGIMCASNEPCVHCVARECFRDRQSHVDEYAVRVKGKRQRILRRTAQPAEFRPDGTLQYVKEILEDVTSERIFEMTMRSVEGVLTSSSEQRFVSTFVLKLWGILKAYKVFIGNFDSNFNHIKTIAVAARGELVANFDYPVSPAPCHRLVDAPEQVHALGVTALYPQCDWLKDKKINGYAGVQLRNSHDKPIGVMVALFHKEIKDPALVKDLMTRFARPAATVLEQLINQRILDKYRHIAATSTDHLALLDKNYVYQVVNRACASFHGLPAEDIVGRPMPAVIGAEVFDASIRPVADACFQGQQGRLQLWLPAGDQSSHCLEMTFYPHYEKGTNSIKGVVLCAEDITRRKKLEDNLRQAAKMEAIGRLAGGIVHDFNNILGAVVGYTELALSIVKNQPDVAEYLNEIRRAGLRATELVKQILAFSRQDSEIRKPVQPKAILKEALSLLRATIPTSIMIRMDLDSEAYLLADPIHLHQIVINLCTNAQHAMRERGGSFSVGLQDDYLSPAEAQLYPDMRPGPHIRMSFADTGHGIPPDVQAKMFDPFFTTKENGQGTGMGLTMVDNIVKSYQGRIDLRSQVGQGTTIEILLPAIDVDKENTIDDFVQVPRGAGQRILVLDDERHLAEVTGTMLANLGYRVHTESDSRTALDLFRSDSKAFDLILSDVAMPEISGDILARKMLALRPDIPIILMTGHSDRVDQNLIREIGVKKLLSKPLLLDVLAAAVREVLDIESA
jgi:PAS domain S-box-containing protein